jgi:ribosomal protein S27E
MSIVYADPAVLWARVLERIENVGGCWVFQGALQTNGYASVSSGKKGRTILGHRLAVLVRDGKLTDLPIDHTCRVRACVNPDHLEVVTTAENNRRMREARGYVMGGQCGSCHELTEENVYRHPRGQLTCRTCAREVMQRHASREQIAQGKVPASVVRAWALEVGLPVAERGRLSPSLRKAYDDAHMALAA